MRLNEIMPVAGQAIQDLIALHSARRFGDMERRARELLARDRRVPILHEMLGIALTAQGRFADAMPPLREAVRLNPDDAQFQENLALCYRQLGQLKLAERHLRKSLEARPVSAPTCNALGSVLRNLGRLDDSEDAFRRAVAIDPQLAMAHFNLANLMSDFGRLHEAEHHYRTTIRLDPAGPASYANLAVLLAEEQRMSEAVAAAEAALDRIGVIGADTRSDLCDAADAAAGALFRAGRFVPAAAIYRRTRGYERTAQQALDAYSAARRACDWELAARIEFPKPPAGARWLSEHAAPFPTLMMGSMTAGDQLAAARTYATRFAVAERLCRTPAASGRRIRVGYLSSDFFNHATAHLIAGVIEAHDRTVFEIRAYDYSRDVEDDYRRRLRQSFDTFTSVAGLSFQQAAQLIADDCCDIVIDLKGWTAGTRSQILAWRPAPVQVQWLGYPGTMGAPWIDYIIADWHVIPAGEERHFSEKVIRLPGTYQPSDSLRRIAATQARAAYGLPDDAVVFCCFNQSFKITAEVFDIWVALLGDVPGSVLWLLQSDPSVQDVLRARTQAKRVDPERLVFAPWAPAPEHLARIASADIALDCWPYGAHTTASDSLRAGVPLIAMRGRTFASRVSASILHAAGLSDLVTDALPDYHDLALRLAADSDLRERTKARAAASVSSSLFDTVRFTRGLEQAYRAILERHRGGRTRDHIAID